MPNAPTSPATRKPLLQRGFAWLWRRPWFRRLFYNVIGLGFRGRLDWRMMNCGWTDPTTPPPASAGTGEKLGQQLYRRLIGDVSLAGRDVLEIGSGRGGGSLFLHEAFAPARVVGLDYAGASVRWCRRHFSRPGLEFRTGQALSLPFPDKSFDAVIAVELTHCIPDKAAFLAETARVIRPGGHLLVADFFYRRPDASHAVDRFRTAIASSAFQLVAEEDLTPGVLAAMRLDGERRARIIRERVPRPLQSIAHYFGGATESSTYQGLASGRAIHLRFELVCR